MGTLIENGDEFGCQGNFPDPTRLTKPLSDAQFASIAFIPFSGKQVADRPVDSCQLPMERRIL